MADFLYSDRLFNALERVAPEPGMLLVSAPGMYSADFARTVILIIDHGPDSTLGIILNRRSDIAVDNVLPEWTHLVAQPQALYIGGPLSPQSAVGVAVTRVGVNIEEHSVLTRLANRLVQVDLRVPAESIAELVDAIRLFAGYAEWAPGQLESEIDRGDWFVAPALPQDVIAPASSDLWGDVMRRQAMPLPLFATFPAELEAN